MAERQGTTRSTAGTVPVTFSLLGQHMNAYNRTHKLKGPDSLGMGLLLGYDDGGNHRAYLRPLAEFMVQTAALRSERPPPAWLNDRFAHTAMAAYACFPGPPAERRRTLPDEQRTAELAGQTALFAVIAEAREAVREQTREALGGAQSAGEAVIRDIEQAFLMLVDLALATDTASSAAGARHPSAA
jgi:hypothetical protein